MQSSQPTAPILRKACLAAALAVVGGSALALDAGGFMRTAVDTTSPPSNSAPGMPGRAAIDRDTRTAPANSDTSTDKAKQAVTDSTITTKIKTKLLSTKDLKSTGIHIKTKDGTVNVSGVVPSQEQHDLALETIRGVDGVTSVNDTLKVSSR
ncbi:BON domain-containing protein [Cupriavidus pinatubonensis]|uniref:BON domain-containing protein n=1 Tax=Cupriavidus pinatubonensis TaxID=248026 RepID=UPI001C730058|nr:BON domain-containing protein [Cupriavidus pinatubonensis]QYY27923.1 BON domain-containing protein [Cupriavidus pinatubonensis]